MSEARTVDGRTDDVEDVGIETADIEIIGDGPGSGPGSGPVTLAATLWLPAGPGPHPGVVMVGGSGPTDRHNDTLFPPIRERLLAAGIAVLSYDKRGVGGSTGDWLTSDYHALAADARAAVRALRSHPAVAADAVGLFGHSEGGFVVLKAAAESAGTDAGVAYVVTNSGSGIPPAEQERSATEAALRRAGVADADVALALACHTRMTDALRARTPLAEVTAWLPDDPGYRFVFPDGGLPEEPLWTFLQGVIAHDPAADLDALDCPHLALFGADDDHVPAQASAARFAAAAVRRGRGSLTTEVFPGGHRIGFENGEFAAGYLDTLVAWIVRQTPPAEA